MKFTYSVDRKLDIFCDALRTPAVGFSVTMRVADALLEVAREVAKEEMPFLTLEMPQMLSLGSTVQSRLRTWTHAHMLPQIVDYCLSGDVRSHMDALIQDLLRFAPVEEMMHLRSVPAQHNRRKKPMLTDARTIKYDPNARKKA